jgi:hypothetical protein
MKGAGGTGAHYFLPRPAARWPSAHPPPAAHCQIESGQRFGPISAAFEMNYPKFHRSVDDFEKMGRLRLFIFNKIDEKCPLLLFGTLIALYFHRFPA